MLVLTGPETASLLEPDALRHAVAAAMADLSAGRASMPSRIAAMVPEHEAFLAAMPAYLPDSGGLAAKLVSLWPTNAGTALPTHQAVIVVFDAGTGRPLALLDGTSVTTARTAAGSAVATDLLARPDAAVLAILGTGVQARAHAEAVVRVRPFRQMRVAGRDHSRAVSLAEELDSRLDIDVVAAAGFTAACAGADVVCATTSAVEPVVRRDMLAPGIHVNSVGFNASRDRLGYGGRRARRDRVARLNPGASAERIERRESARRRRTAECRRCGGAG